VPLWPVLFAGVATLPDLDLLVGLHSRYTHSIGAALVVFAAAFVVLSRSGWRTLRLQAHAALAIGLSYASHVLLDWLGADSTPPFGIMALWPFSDAFYVSPVPIFLGISRRYWLAAAWKQNAASLLREVIILVPLAVLAVWSRPPVGRKRRLFG
jgi:membrane-bound metal-dependent hydrolase YbcI (DUF457 family)